MRVHDRAMPARASRIRNPDPDFQHRLNSLLIERSCVRRDTSGFEVSVSLPSTKLIAAGTSYREAFEKFCGAVTVFVFENPRHIDQGPALIDWLLSKRPPATERNHAKPQQKTIGVSSKLSLIALIEKHGNGDRATAARELFIKGFLMLDQRLDSENSIEVFRDFQISYDRLPDSQVEQWMLRLTPKAHARAVVRAHEYEKSASDLARLCIAYALSH